jgi:hypothetical protein
LHPVPVLKSPDVVAIAIFGEVVDGQVHILSGKRKFGYRLDIAAFEEVGQAAVFVDDMA